jgi:hypothetical protein
MVVGSLVSIGATSTGFVAASIAVMGFLWHVAPALSGASEVTVRRATAAGGLMGFGLSVFVILLSALID